MASTPASRTFDGPTVTRPDRPCDACRRRKSRCVINADADAASCGMCDFHGQACTFVEEVTPRKRKPTNPGNADNQSRQRRSDPDSQPSRRQSGSSDREDVEGGPLLKKTLGLQHHRYAKYIGPTDEHDFALLDLRLYDATRSESPADQGSFRKVETNGFFHQFADADQVGYAQEVVDVDRIERLVQPHGQALIKLYFRIIHPSFPILHQRVYLEKYARTHREFSPPLLAAVYILALNWWSYDADLAKHTKPNVVELEDIAFRTLQDVSQRAKLSTVQAGLLLLQRPSSTSSWQLTCQIVGIGQDLGLHLDASNWKVPAWERSLRKRLAWAMFMQDTWSALIYGRPPHISLTNWGVQPIVGSDFPEDAVDEAEEDDVEQGRTLFNAMITLTQMLSDVLEDLYSLKAEMTIKHSYDPTKAVLERAKPIQVKLKTWWADMPDSLRMDSTKTGKLSSVGYLHLAYFATEITLHRRIIRSLSANTDSYLTQICRSAAKARLISAMDFFNRLKPEHLQSFWYFASKFNFALIGTFAGLCFVTSVSQEEGEFYQRRVQEYRWTLRVSNKSAEFLEIASGILESAVGSLLKAANSIDSKGLSFPMLQQGSEHDAFTNAFLPNAEQGPYDTDMER